MSQNSSQRVVTMDFLALCLLIFLTYCNTTVFYSLDVFLDHSGVGPQWRGFLIGSSSLATIAAYLAVSPFMTVRRSIPFACCGAGLLILCGFSYLWARSPWEFLLLRLGNGLAVSLLLSAATTLFVRIIPPGVSGRAFGFYSLAGLLPFCVVPAAFDRFTADPAQTARGYMLMSLFLVPALALLLTKGRHMSRAAQAAEGDGRDKAVNFRTMASNAAKAPVALLLMMNMLYLIMFSSMFFLAKSFFLQRPVADVGTFFTLQMLCIMAIRLLAMGIFDKARKTVLVMLAFAMSSAGCVLTATAHGPVQAYAAAVVLGAGMGLGSPVLNSLMFSISEKRFQAVNTNLMNMFVQMGNFLGPIIGAAAVQYGGETGFLTAGAVAGTGAFLLCALFALKGMDRAADQARHAHAASE